MRWNLQRLDLQEGRRLEAACRANVDTSHLRLDIKRQYGGEAQEAAPPLGLSFSNGYLSLGAVTRQDDGLQFVCSHEDASDTLTLTVHSASTRLSLRLALTLFFSLIFFRWSNSISTHCYSLF